MRYEIIVCFYIQIHAQLQNAVERGETGEPTLLPCSPGGIGPLCLRSIAAQTMSASNTTAAACQAVRRRVVGEVPMAVTSLMGGSVGIQYFGCIRIGAPPPDGCIRSLVIRCILPMGCTHWMHKGCIQSAHLHPSRAANGCNLHASNGCNPWVGCIPDIRRRTGGGAS